MEASKGDGNGGREGISKRNREKSDSNKKQTMSPTPTAAAVPAWSAFRDRRGRSELGGRGGGRRHEQAGLSPKY